MSESADHWNQLHANPRFRPLYPSEHVVRFLVSVRKQLASAPAPRFLDVGAGAGRHLALAGDLGFLPVGTDLSETGLIHARERLLNKTGPHLLAVSSMTDIPFPNAVFDTVLSYGVFYYGYAHQMKRSIGEVLRVLKAGCKALIVLRTTDDYRFGKGQELEPHTFQLDITETNEFRTIQHFLTARQLPEYFTGFSRISFEKTETTFSDRSRLNSDWLVTAEK